ncbi:ATP-binding protein [Sphaerisporangium dianthi]|uniref:ATP-binding protein n=1 Tax=Sphaerisporangium dianthi TaxID=1436120 RepID=A0ABV9CC43_9ACTN
MNRDEALEARPRGRHRPGAAPAQVTPRPWDASERAAAEQLDQMEPVWAIWYGMGSRRFYAVATWPLPGPLLVQAGTADELRDLMRASEQAVLYRSGPDRAATRVAGRLVSADRFARMGDPTTDGASMTPTRDGGLRTACWDLSDDLSLVGKTRAMVREVLATWALATIADDVILAVAELLANAMTYGKPPVRLSLWLSAEDLCVRVTDHGPELPRRLDLDIEAVHGRGLTIIDALADDAGVTLLPDGQGKTVWCRWRLPADTPRSA